ncbi:MAG: glycogen debranching protein GlgX [Spirochaetales bacterium]|nr:glycogen debranching protein GlgX [Spirochaetales bacterium]
MIVHPSPGRPLPLGATLVPGGVQFAVISRHATDVHLLLYERPEDAEPAAEVRLDPRENRTGDIWHVQVSGLGAGAYYLYRAFGPYDPKKGHRFNPNKLLLDPYAKAVTGSFTWNLADARGYDAASPNGDLSFSEVPDAAGMPKCIVIDDAFDWQGDRPLNRPLRFSVIYETHVRGLTLHSSSKGFGVRHPGTFRGVAEMIPYLTELGITAVELLPVQEFDEQELQRTNPLTGEPLQNYWGYSTMSFFAPKGSYSSAGSLGEQVTEFKEMVRELHRAGIEVILDVVFNHTAEGDERGPTLCFRGWDNSIFYMLEADKRHYKNYSGCGNTLNCNHPLVRSLIIDCLRYWVVEMHVDGFRFDLGSVLGRDSDGKILENPPVVERIAEDPVLRQTKIIAEAWDAAGAYQVGSFPGGRWAEWNDRFRDDVRAFWRGDDGRTASRLATRITGSSDLYLRDGRKPFHSINFVTSHDGFTLNDLVSYSRKHNEANGEGNRDGSDENLSANCGIEGPTDDPGIEALRDRQVKNFLATLFLSLGTPMLLGGDEMRRTQGGNNNAYCQNNEVSWYDWGRLETYREIHRFCRQLIAFRGSHPAFHRPEFYSGEDRDRDSLPDITWFDRRGRPRDWSAAERTLACRVDGSKAETEADRDDNDFFLMFNAESRALRFILCPAGSGKRWFRVIDTARPAPGDILSPGEEQELVPQERCVVRGRSLVVLLSRGGGAS